MTTEVNEMFYDATERARHYAVSSRRAIEQAILATPTGERRNLMTEVNIHLMQALEKLTEIQRMGAKS